MKKINRLSYFKEFSLDNTRDYSDNEIICLNIIFKYLCEREKFDPENKSAKNYYEDLKLLDYETFKLHEILKRSITYMNEEYREDLHGKFTNLRGWDAERVTDLDFLLEYYNNYDDEIFYEVLKTEFKNNLKPLFLWFAEGN